MPRSWFVTPYSPDEPDMFTRDSLRPLGLVLRLSSGTQTATLHCTGEINVHLQFSQESGQCWYLTFWIELHNHWQAIRLQVYWKFRKVISWHVISSILDIWREQNQLRSPNYLGKGRSQLDLSLRPPFDKVILHYLLNSTLFSVPNLSGRNRNFRGRTRLLLVSEPRTTGRESTGMMWSTLIFSDCVISTSKILFTWYEWW